MPVQQLHLCARPYHRILKLARTIADLVGAEGIETPHLIGPSGKPARRTDPSSPRKSTHGVAEHAMRSTLSGVLSICSRQHPVVRYSGASLLRITTYVSGLALSGIVTNT